MATVCVSSFRLFKFTQTSRLLTKFVLNIPLIKTVNLENIVLVQNIRVFSKDEGEYKPKHRFGTPEVARKKTVPVQKVLLLSSEGKVIEELIIEEAQQLAKRRNLNLVQVVDLGFKTTLPTYQLMSKMQLAKEGMKAKHQKNLEKSTTVKDTKLLIISSKIGKHDLETKINKIGKLLKKNYKVQVYIATDGNKLAAESVIKTIENGTAGDGKMKSKVPKGSGIKIYLEPIIPATPETDKMKEEKSA
ncbi:translation initiation factor IF-3, mitochondrial [Belonocnema kinseyi]|uniref:translation initiation factor IF-3, mitochondrial n=1 Tax=Belonocnema kinseyi TaxID=2817044 RepID=UPI00143DC134|nr:translation initiation factor IF-3, mitochondrial [Belonocnema kinseyi]XP_033216716.1 translation initiation factor IF-3, mitochondrial [Belonocnema kinseyi]